MEANVKDANVKHKSVAFRGVMRFAGCVGFRSLSPVIEQGSS